MSGHVDIFDAEGNVVPVATDLVGEDEYQKIKLSYGADGSATPVAPESPMPTSDFSPAVVQLAAGGFDLGAGGAENAVVENLGRTRVLIQHAGTTGRLWIRFDGADAAPGIGEFCAPGQQWSEYTTGAVSVYFEGSGTCRVATSELGAG